jgi:cytochrome c peroxidase
MEFMGVMIELRELAYSMKRTGLRQRNTQKNDCPSMNVFRIGLAILAILLGATSGAWAAEVPVPAEMRLEALPAQAPDPAGNPSTPAKVALGRLLFFDPILSGTDKVACATCHHPRFGWADGRATPLGVSGTGLGPARLLNEAAGIAPLARNAPTVLNVGFNGLVAGQQLDPKAAPMFWDARVQSLEEQMLHPLRSREEMRGDVCGESDAVEGALNRVRKVAEYRRRFSEAFSQPEEEGVTASHLTKAIAAFERSLIAADSPFDQFMRGEEAALSGQQLRGMRVFQSAGCILCHGGPMFSDFKLHFIGVTDSSPDGRRELRTPTLRNLRQSAPYMHNGSMRTLDEVLAFYEQLSDAVSETLDGGDAAAQPALDPLLKRLDLKAEDFADLEAFLETLNDDGYDRSVPAKVPSGLTVAGD